MVTCDTTALFACWRAAWAQATFAAGSTGMAATWWWRPCATAQTPGWPAAPGTAPRFRVRPPRFRVRRQVSVSAAQLAAPAVP